MLTKLKLLGLAGVGLFFVITFITNAVTTYQLHNLAHEYREAIKSTVVDGHTVNAIEQLEIRVEQNEQITKTSLGRLDDLQEEAINRPPTSLPPQTPLVQTVIVETRQQKEPVHDVPKVVNPQSSSVALRAINELWVDFCEQFPGDSDCRKREAEGKEL